MENSENCIEWLTGQHTITCTISQGKYISKIKRLAEIRLMSMLEEKSALATAREKGSKEGK